MKYYSYLQDFNAETYVFAPSLVRLRVHTHRRTVSATKMGTISQGLLQRFDNRKRHPGRLGFKPRAGFASTGRVSNVFGVGVSERYRDVILSYPRKGSSPQQSL